MRVSQCDPRSRFGSYSPWRSRPPPGACVPASTPANVPRERAPLAFVNRATASTNRNAAPANVHRRPRTHYPVRSCLPSWFSLPLLARLASKRDRTADRRSLVRYRRPRMPLGVLPYRMWCRAVPEPTVADLLTRWLAVYDAVNRFREAGFEPDPAWLLEVGLLPCSLPRTRHRTL